LAQRVALITGASSGIGLELARTLAELGYALTLVARRADKLENAVSGLREQGYTVAADAANVGNEEELVAVFARHRERYGRLDVLVNNAGIGIGQVVEQISAKHLEMQMAVNFGATVIGTREGLPMLRQAAAENGTAQIINMASFGGKVGQPFISVYGATKAAIVNFSEATQKELGDTGIKVTAICPGLVETAMTEFIREQVPAEQMLRPSDVAAAMRFVLETSPNCFVPEIVLARQAELSGNLY
jgi:short-subunit dehydrogenase